MANFLPPGLSKQLHQMLLSHVRFVRDDRVPYTSVALEDGGYTMIFGARYFDMDDEHKRTMLLHELGHMLRGDCLVGKEYDRKLHNICSDAHINAHLCRQHIEDSKGVLYEDLLKELPPDHGLPTDHLPGTIPLYNAMMENMPEVFVAGRAAGECAQPYEGNDPAGARAKHVKLVLEARDLPDSDKQGLGRDMSVTPARIRPNASRSPQPLLQRVLSAIKGSGRGARQMARTHLRPGRVPGMRGSHRLPRLSIFLAVDGSGSCSAHYQQLAGLASWLERTCDVTMVAFDTEVRPAKRATDLHLTGGGTDFAPVWRAALGARADVVLMATDGEAPIELPNGLPRVVWLLTGANESVAESLRTIDRQLTIERA